MRKNFELLELVAHRQVERKKIKTQDNKKRLWQSDKVGRYKSETDEPDTNQAMVTIGVDGKTCNKQGGTQARCDAERGELSTDILLYEPVILIWVQRTSELYRQHRDKLDPLDTL
jgi:hypothetical protein